MNATATDRQMDDGVFFDPLACVHEAAKAAHNRNRLYVAACRDGRSADADRHKEMRDFLIGRARMWQSELTSPAKETLQ